MAHRNLRLACQGKLRKHNSTSSDAAICMFFRAVRICGLLQIVTKYLYRLYNYISSSICDCEEILQRMTILDVQMYFTILLMLFALSGKINEINDDKGD